MSGVLPTENGLLLTPLATAHTTLDDGAGNATVGGALSVKGAQSGSTLSLSGNATVGGYIQEGTPFYTSAIWFGADPTGTTDSTSAIQAALNQAGASGGGIVTLPTGIYIISQTLTIETSGVSLLGEGRGGQHDTGSFVTAPVQLIWKGAAGGTMVSIAPSGTQALRSCNFDGIYLSSNAGVAAVGLAVLSCSESIHRFAGDSFTTSIVTYGCATTLDEAADCQHNDIWVRGYQIATTNAGYLFYATGSATADFSFNNIHEISGNYGYQQGVVIANADNNDFYSIHLFKISGAPADINGLLLVASPNAANQACRSNNFWHLSAGAGGVYSEGTEKAAYPAVDNNIVFYDIQNGDPVPNIGTSSTLWWGSNAAPLGMRQPLNISENNFLQFSDGRMRYSGLTGSIAAGGNVAITFSTPFPTAVLSANCVPTSGNPAYVIPTQTGITIYNTGAASATYWWSVEGV